MTILLAKKDFDAAIVVREIFQKGSDLRICGGVIGETDFPVFINLPTQRRDGFAQKFQLTVVDRQDDRNQRPVIERENFVAETRASFGR